MQLSAPKIHTGDPDSTHATIDERPEAEALESREETVSLCQCQCSYESGLCMKCLLCRAAGSQLQSAV